MLVLSRLVDEKIRIGDDISITVLYLKGERIGLGISAPPDVPVHREEVYQAILRENAQQGGDDAQRRRVWPESFTRSLVNANWPLTQAINPQPQTREDER